MRNPGETMQEEPIVLKEEYRAAMKDKITGYEIRFRDQTETGTAAPADLLDTRLKLIAAKDVYESGTLMWEDYLSTVEGAMTENDKRVIAAYDAEALRREKAPLVANAYHVIQGYASNGGAAIRGGSGFGVGKHT